MAGTALLSLALILVLGVGASWLAWRLEVPSILLLLLAGFLAGPVAGWLAPDQLFGDLLLPLVSFSVAIILFEGGLSLRVIELEEVGSVVRNLVTVGVLVTWIVTTGAAYLLLDLGFELSLLLGAVLVVTGPTVIVPLLRHLRPRANVSNALKWEGILIDPIGVILSVGVFRAILAPGARAPTALFVTIGKALVLGTLVGIVGAVAVYVALKRDWTPDVLHVPVTLAFVGAAFVAAEALQAEAGLVTATIMGVVLANREDFVKRHIVEFKENLRTLLIGFLFVVLAARLDLSDLTVVGPSSLAFLVVLFLVARPLAVWLSTIGSDLDWRERTFLSAMAPRGIVAAAIASVFALELAENNVLAGLKYGIAIVVLSTAVFVVI
jgi:NhaP-type Na+/H+ or K+/H+ antiporter